MRGNPFVNLVAILVMLISVLTAGKVWIDWKANKGEVVRKELQVEKKQSNMDNSFESRSKITEVY